MAQDGSFPQLLEALKAAPTAPDAKAAADALAREVQKQGLQSLMCVLPAIVEIRSYMLNNHIAMPQS